MALEQAGLLTTAVIVAAAITFILLERRFPYTQGQAVWREGFWNDLAMYTLLQSYVLGIIIGGAIAWMDTQTGWSRLRVVSGWAVWQQVLFFFIVHDFYIYWFHRWQHRSRWLWRTHEAHHATPEVDWLSGSRSHSVEILINQTIEFAPMVLLGAAPEVPLIKGALDAVWGMYIHSNLNVRAGWLQRVFNGPEMHRWHHAIEIREGGINFGTKLAVWDWLFGTAYLPAHKPSGYGLDDAAFPLTDTSQPLYRQLWSDTKNYFRQHLYAFRPMESDARKNSTNASSPVVSLHTTASAQKSI